MGRPLSSRGSNQVVTCPRCRANTSQLKWISTLSSWKWLKPRPEYGLDWPMCSLDSDLENQIPKTPGPSPNQGKSVDGVAPEEEEQEEYDQNFGHGEEEEEGVEGGHDHDHDHSEHVLGSISGRSGRASSKSGGGGAHHQGEEAPGMTGKPWG